MKKLLLAGVVYCGLFLTNFAYSQVDTAANAQTTVQETDEHYWSQDGRKWNSGQYQLPEGCCDTAREDHACPPEEQTNDCYCKYVRYEPCYYYTKRCVVENKYQTKQMCRTVPKYYEVQRCKMVPQYYTETVCKQEKENYCVQECVPCKKYVSERHCKYVPRYYWKHVCGSVTAQQPTNDCNTCGR